MTRDFLVLMASLAVFSGVEGFIMGIRDRLGVNRKRSLAGLVVVFVVGVYIGTHIPSLSHVASSTSTFYAPPLITKEIEPRAAATNKATAPQKNAAPEPNPEPKRVVDKNDPDANIHVIFPSGCNAFQQWQVPRRRSLPWLAVAELHKHTDWAPPQAELLLWSHHKSGQKGKITRIVHGCEDNSEIKDMKHLPHPGGDLDKNQDIDTLHASTHPDWTLYSTPGVEGKPILSSNTPCG